MNTTFKSVKPGDDAECVAVDRLAAVGLPHSRDVLICLAALIESLHKNVPGGDVWFLAHSDAASRVAAFGISEQEYDFFRRQLEAHRLANGSPLEGMFA